MTTSKIEFNVQMTCEKCVNSVESVLSNLDGVSRYQINLEQGSVIVETTLPYSKVQETIENTGRRAVLKGYGESEFSAVSMLGGDSGYSFGENVKGVVRFVQNDEDCIIDGTIDGLSKGAHGLHIHECGDISKGCESIGDHYNPTNAPHGGPNNSTSQKHVGDLGNIIANENGRATFKMMNKFLRVQDIIGRSLAVTENEDDLGLGNNEMTSVNGNSGKCLACGIIARSSGLFQNSKKICACDGLTLWDERNISLNKHDLRSNLTST